MIWKVPIDLLSLYGRFGREANLSLRDPVSQEAFIADVRKSLGTAINNDILMHGQRTENMFAALVISLGHYELLNREDNGATHPSSEFQAPDFRVVPKNAGQCLIEVKNFYDREPGRQLFEIKPEYLAKLQRYADAVGCPLKFAIYWARWSAWALIDPADLKQQEGKLTCSMIEALKVNQMAMLGDRMIGTTPPLKFRVNVDKTKPREIKASGEVAFTPSYAAFYSGDVEITDPVEQNIAWILADVGSWICEGPLARIEDDQLEAVELIWMPVERSNPNERFETIGTLSTMFSRFYAAKTLDEHGIKQIEADVVPGWLSPLVASDLRSKALPLWRFILQPHRPNVPILEASSDPD
ncbi:hypothetical protein ACQR1H_22870 [Bradyrhizobium sp. HKCCYLRH2015]|uniref:hypothetical protein n=1 Tax=Bradyrhizobium sp. HKCCYLRH2015 TaxID=3420742 RepID=UPI003EB77B1E